MKNRFRMNYTLIIWLILAMSVYVNEANAQGVNITWNGNTSNDWSTPSNWDLGVVPVSGIHYVVIPSGLSRYPVLTANSACRSIFSMGSGSSIGGTGFTLTPTVNTNISVAGNATISCNLAGGNITYAMTDGGSGVLTLSGDNTFTSTFQVIKGTLKLGASGGVTYGPLGTTGGGTTVSSGGVLDLNGFTLGTAEALTISGKGILDGGAFINSSATVATYSGAVALGAVSSIGGTGDITISGAVSGNYALTKVGKGVLQMGTNSSTAAINVSEGILKLGSSSSLGAPSAAGTTVLNGATIDLNGQTYTSTEPLSLSGTGVGGLGALTNSSLTQATFKGVITFTAAASIVGECGTIAITGTPVSSDVAIILGGSAGGSIGTVIAGARNLVKEGNGTWTLSGINTYSGATTISAGTLKMGSTTALGASTTTTVIASGAALDLSGFTISTARPLTLNGTGVLSGGALMNSGVAANYSGVITLASASSIGTTGSISLSGGITGGQNLTKVGAATLSLGTVTSTLNGLDISGGSLTSTSGTLSIAGDFNNNGTFTHNNGTVTLNGTGAQTINSGGSSFNNLTITNTGGTCTASTSGITAGTLTVNAGSKLTNTGNTTATTLNIPGDPTGTVGTGTFIDNGTIDITIANINQYLSSARNWYVSSPVDGAKAKEGYIFYKRDEVHNTWPTLTLGDGTTTGDVLNSGQGYIANLASGTTTYTFTGALKTGDVTTPSLTRQGSISAGFNLVGNPYPSYLNLSATDGTNMYLDTTKVWGSYWIRTNTISGYDFDTYNLSLGVGTFNNGVIPSSFIPAMQAFWIRVKDGNTSTSLTFKNAMRSHINTPTNLFRAPSVAQANCQLLYLDVNNGLNEDQTILAFTPNASNGLDAYDTPKFSNNSKSVAELFTTVGTEQLAINGMNSIPDTEIPLGFNTLTAGTFSIRASQIKNFDADTRITLKDNLLNTEQDLSDGTSYTFTSDVANTTSRFSVLFKSVGMNTDVHTASGKPSVLIYRNDNNQIVVNCNGSVNGDAFVSVYNALGQKLESKPMISTITIIGRTFASGVYVVNVHNEGISTTRKVILN